MRFDGGTNVAGEQEDWSWEADRQGSQDSATKDSGIDTSSTFTSSEDSNRGDLPKVRLRQPVSLSYCIPITYSIAFFIPA